MSRQTGEGKVGCFVTLLLLIMVGFIAFRVVPVLIDKMDFEDQLERIASESGARLVDPEVVRNQVMELAKNKDFMTGPENLVVRRSGGRGGDLRIRVSYWRTVDFGIYVYTFRFHADVKSFVGTL